VKTAEEDRKKVVFIGLRIDAETAEELQAIASTFYETQTGKRTATSLSRVVRDAVHEYVRRRKNV
jgi:hypothetical protein